MLLGEKTTVHLVPRARDDLLLIDIAVQLHDHLTLGKLWSREGDEVRLFLNELGEKHRSLIF